MKRKIYVVHGYTASSHANWFPWLKERLENDQTKVLIPDLPDSKDPYLTSWLEALSKSFHEMDENTIVIGHSLGCIAALRFVLATGKRIKGAVLVSGFSEVNPMADQKEGLQTFLEASTDYEKCKTLIPSRVVITAKDDDIVPTEATKAFAERLDAEFVTLKNGMHFIDRDGFTEFPLVVEWVEKLDKIE